MLFMVSRGENWGWFDVGLGLRLGLVIYHEVLVTLLYMGSTCNMYYL